MVELAKITRVYIYPGYTDMRLGNVGLRKLVEDVETQALYIFCGKGKNSIKMIEVQSDCCWLYQKKLFRGKFLWPTNGDINVIDKDQLLWILEGMSLINSIETRGKSQMKSIY